MIRPKLPHPLSERRSSRSRHRRRGSVHAATVIPGATASATFTAATAAPAQAPAVAASVPSATVEPAASGRALNLDIQRAQAAGGPVDQACYSCACGYLFSAEVSTSVACPHCGTGQAW